MNTKKTGCMIAAMLVCIMYAFTAQAQVVNTPTNTFIVTAKQNSDDAKAAIQAAEKTDFSNYRLRTIHRKLTFSNGVIIELLSAKEMQSLGYNINLLNYPEKLDANYIEPIYSVSPNGILMQLHQNASTPSKSKIN